MIVKISYKCCSKCGSSHIVKNGKDYKKSQKYHCNDCKGYGTLDPEERYSEAKREQILRAYLERMSLRGVERVFGVARQTVASWILKKVRGLPSLCETLRFPKAGQPILELDELWSFVAKKVNQRWIWIAFCRQTRQVVAFVIGDRSQRTCHILWDRIPKAFKQGHSYSDFWDAYQAVFPKETHLSVGKESGQTAHVERVNNTFRQRIGRLVRKSLSFSKSTRFHWVVFRLFLHFYNLEWAPSVKT